MAQLTSNARSDQRRRPRNLNPNCLMEVPVAGGFAERPARAHHTAAAHGIGDEEHGLLGTIAAGS